MRILRVIIILIAALLIIAGAFMLINGSLEMYPTSEQQGKAHIAGAVLALIGIMISIITCISWKKKK